MGPSLIANLIMLSAGGLVLYKLSDVLGISTNKQEKRTQDYIDQVQVNESGLRMPKTIYMSIANTQQSEMASQLLGMDFYDFDTMYNGVKDLNPDELRMVYKSYGIRKSKLFRAIEFGDAGDLFEWYRAYLSTEDVSRIESVWVKSGLVPNKYSPYGNPRNPNPATADQWQPIPYNVTRNGAVLAYPRYTNFYMLGFVRDANGSAIPYRTIKITKPTTIGYIIQAMGSSSQNKAAFVKIRITDPSIIAAYPFVKETDMWFLSSYINLKSPMQGLEQANLY